MSRLEPGISGTTRLYAILADPVAQVRTPELLNALLAGGGRDGVMVPMHVGGDALAAAVAGLRNIRNLAGFIATVPHKVAMVELCDEVTPAAAAVGAVNAVRREADGRLVGHILDGIGFVRGLRQADVSIEGKDVFLAGAGGAAKAIAFALAEGGAARLRIHNRTAARVHEIADRLAQAGHRIFVEAVGDDPAGCDIAINATSLGMASDDPLPFAVERLGSGQVVAEIIMKPAVTPLLAIAAARGCMICPGAPMLECQIELMADFMDGV